MLAEVRALIAHVAVGVLDGNVYLGEAPANLAPPYVVVIPGRDDDDQTRLTGAHATERISVSIRCVGETAEQAAWFDDLIDARLRPRRMGMRLTVPGRECSRIERRASDLYPDDSLTRVWESITAYRFTSTPKEAAQ